MQVKLQKPSLHLSLGRMKFIQQAQSSLSLPDNFLGGKKGGVDFLSLPGSECLTHEAIKFP